MRILSLRGVARRFQLTSDLGVAQAQDRSGSALGAALVSRRSPMARVSTPYRGGTPSVVRSSNDR